MVFPTAQTRPLDQPQPRIGVLGWIFGDKDHIAQNVAALAVMVLLGLLIALCFGVPSVAAAVTATALITGVCRALHDMLRSR